MPHILDPHSASNLSSSDTSKALKSVDEGYDYPEGLNLRPGFPKHDRLVSMLLSHARESQRVMSSRHRDWRKIDRNLKAYIYQPRQRKKTPQDKHTSEEYNRIILPVSYVILETLLTYMTSVFIRQPLFKYEGVGPEDVRGGLLLTEVIERHVKRLAVPLALHTIWRDAFAYGIGAGHATWHRVLGRRQNLRPQGFIDRARRLFLQTGEVAEADTENRVLFEGNKLESIDPYLMLPDPNVPAHEAAEGQFFGWLAGSNLMKLLSEEDASDDMFNVRYLKLIGRKESNIFSSSGRRGGDRREKKINRNDPVDILWMYVTLIPNDWDLGSGSLPEEWVFALAADKVIIKAGPTDLNHNSKPVAVAAPDYDGYSIAPLSRLLLVEEYQRLADFRISAQNENMKRMANNRLVVDPSLVFMSDVNDSRPGKVIRLKKRAWGRGLAKDAVHQLQVQDFTQGLLDEADRLGNMAQDAAGAGDPLQGVPAQRTSRISAAESRDLRTASLSRLEKAAIIISYQLMQPLGRLFASHTQQFMTEDLFVKTTGTLGDRLREVFGEAGLQGQRNERLRVSPLQIASIDYDLSVHDGAIPGKEDPRLWVELFQVMAQNPEIGQQFDMLRVFRHIARQMGAKNPEDFIRRAEVVPDQVVQQQAAAGNAVPLPAGDGALL